MKKKKTFLINTVILTVTALILRAIGLFFRVYLSNVIGAEGMGLYQLIFSVYMLFSTFATSGISTAITRLCADEMAMGSKQSVFAVLKKSIKLSAVLGCLINILVFAFSSPIATIFIGDERAIPALKILSFSLVPMGVCACFKGYFTARRKALQPSVSSIFEQIVRMVAVFFLLAHFAQKGLETACFAVLAADTIAETASCVFIAICYKLDQKNVVSSEKSPRFCKHILKEIIRISMPITAGKYLTSLLLTVENLTVPKSLSRFSGDKSSGLEVFGLIKGMALPIIFFPASLLISVSALLIPELSSLVAQNDFFTIRKDVNRVLNITILGSVLAAGCFFLCADKIGRVLYNSEQCGVLISTLSPLIPLMYTESVVTGILKGLDKQKSIFIYGVFDSLIRIIAVIFVVPFFGLDGFLAVMYFSNIFTCSLNFIKLLRVTNLSFQTLNWFLKPLLAICCGVIFAKRICEVVTNDLAYIIISCAIITLIYLVFLIITKAINFKNVEQIIPSKN